MTWTVVQGTYAQPFFQVNGNGEAIYPGAATGAGMSQAEFIAALKSTTCTKSSVNSGTSSVTILAANSARKGASVKNSDANRLNLEPSGGTAVAAQTGVELGAGNTLGTYWECPFGYTGLITGIWDVDGVGAAIVEEYV